MKGFYLNGIRIFLLALLNVYAYVSMQCMCTFTYTFISEMEVICHH